MKNRGLIIGLLVGVAGLAGAAEKPVKAKLATLAPKDSSPHQLLKTMGAAWRTAPNGGVQVTFFTDGTQGSEADMVRRMRIGQLQGALLTGSGLAEIDNSVTALQTMPLVYQTLDEVDHVREQLRGKLETRLAANGFVMLFWTDAGWVKFFTRHAVVTPEEFKREKIFAWAGDNKTLEIMKALGYQPVPLETADILPGLQTGLIDAVPAPPFFALAGQFYGPAKHMLDMNWAPLVGGLVVTRKFWDSLPVEQQAVLRAAAEKAGDEIRRQARKEMDESVAAMTKRGLQVHALTPAAAAAWQKLAESAYPRIRGTLVPADLFDEVLGLLKQYRAGNKS